MHFQLTITIQKITDLPQLIAQLPFALTLEM